MPLAHLTAQGLIVERNQRCSKGCSLHNQSERKAAFISEAIGCSQEEPGFPCL